MRLYCIPQLSVFEFVPFTRTSIHPVDVGIQVIFPSATALTCRSTRNQRCGPILATVRVYCILQLAVPFNQSILVHWTGRCWNPRMYAIHSCTVFLLDPVLHLRPNACCHTFVLYCLPQLGQYIHPFGRGVGIQGIVPLTTTLPFHSTCNQLGHGSRIHSVLLAVLLLAGIRNCTVQTCVFYWCPASCRPGILHGVYVIISRNISKKYCCVV
jgi:hypothetical protein